MKILLLMAEFEALFHSSVVRLKLRQGQSAMLYGSTIAQKGRSQIFNIFKIFQNLVDQSTGLNESRIEETNTKTIFT